MGAADLGGRDELTPLVPFTVGIETITHALVKLRRDTHLEPGAGLRWSRINAGNRAQVEWSATNMRHFRVASASVKSGDTVIPTARSLRFPSLRRQNEAAPRPTAALSLTALPCFS